MTDHDIRLRSWVRASEADYRTGLLGYVTASYGELILDGITVRRTADGDITLSFPAKTDRAGRRHAYVRPADDAARRRLEREILGGLGRDGDVEASTCDDFGATGGHRGD